MLKKFIKILQKTSKSAIVIYPLLGLLAAIATKYIINISDDGNASPDYLVFWLATVVPVVIVPGIIIWCANEFFPRMIKTIVILFLIGAVFSVWLGATIHTIDF